MGSMRTLNRNSVCTDSIFTPCCDVLVAILGAEDKSSHCMSWVQERKNTVHSFCRKECIESIWKQNKDTMLGVWATILLL